MTTPDVPADDGLPPGQPYVSPDDLASVAPLWDAQVAQLLPLVAEIYQQSAGKIHAGLIEETGLPDLPGASSLAAESYLAGVQNVYEGVGDQLWSTARTQLVEGFQNGESIPQLAARLRASAGMTAKDAVLVARSTVVEASNAASIQTARVSGLEMEKEWLATPDARTRPTHVAAGGQRVPLNEPFTVGGFSADAPGDPGLPPEEKYRCRCTVGYVMGRNDVHQAQHEAHQQAQQDALPGTVPSAVSEDVAPPLLSEMSPAELVDSGVPELLSAPPTVRPAGAARGFALPPVAPAAPLEASPALAQQMGRSTARAAARARNQAIARVEPVARLAADIDQALGAAAGDIRLSETTRKVLEQALNDARAAGLTPEDVARIERGVAAGNISAIEDTTARLANEHGLTAIGQRGEIVKYDPDVMEPISSEASIRRGQRVTVWRQGHTFEIDGDTVQLDRAVVKTIPKPVPLEPPTPIEVAKRGAPNESQPSLGELFKTLKRGKAAEKRAAEQAIRDGLNGQYADLMVEADSVAMQDNVIYVSGRVIDLEGNEVGEFSRHLRRDPDGKLVAVHESLEIDPSVQGSGFANEFNQNLYDWYRRSGVDRVELYADIDVGGYAWATQGYDFADAEAFDTWATSASVKLEHLRLGRPYPGAPAGSGLQTDRELQSAFPDFTPAEIRTQLDELESRIAAARQGDTPLTAFEISQWGRKPGQTGRDATWLGKWITKGSHWDGVKPL
jgi:hypothetical protein